MATSASSSIGLDRVLVVIDGTPASQTALDQALAFCNQAKRVAVLSCEGTECSSSGAPSPDHAVTLAMYDADRQSTSLVQTRSGEPVGEAIARVGVDLGADLIIVAMPRDILGAIPARERITLIEEIALNGQCPVMVLRPEWVAPEKATDLAQRIVVPLDGSAASRRALPLAAVLAHRFDADVHLLSVIDPVRMLPGAYAYLHPTDQDRQDAIATLAFQANQSLDGAVAELRARGIEPTSELLQGPIQACLLDGLRTGDLVVMATHGAGKAAQSRFGSVAFAVMRESPHPVIVLNSPPWMLPDEHASASWIPERRHHEHVMQTGAHPNPGSSVSLTEYDEV